MQELFKESARHAIVLAQEETKHFGHTHIGREHILLGLLHEEGVAHDTLEALGITIKSARAKVEELAGRGTRTEYPYILFTPRAKRMIDYSLRAALQLGHNYIGTEHLLLGFAMESAAPAKRANHSYYAPDVAAQMLDELGVDLNQIRPKMEQLFPALFDGSSTQLFVKTPVPPRKDASTPEQVKEVVDEAIGRLVEVSSLLESGIPVTEVNEKLQAASLVTRKAEELTRQLAGPIPSPTHEVPER